MDLSNDLISKFVKITNDGDKKESKEGTVYGTTVEYDGAMYVKIDGSDLLTPINTTADIKEGERVTIMIKDHNATVTGNITSPSASSADVKKVTRNVEEIEGEITEFEAIIADVVHVGELDAEVARIDELIAGKATIADLTATNAEITNLKAKDAEIENLIADVATVENLTAINADITNLKAKDAEIENLVADKATIEDLTATNARIDSLQANKADITYLDANFATIDELEATHAEIEILDGEVADINTLVNGNLTSDNILSLNITSQNTTVENAFIKDAMIDTITANKIMSGTIDTNNVTIQSTDGSMLLQGTLLQMKDDNGKVRIQIGKDTGGNFTFILYDESGTGVLIDEEGIKSSDAIADGLIVDAKVADNANIAGSKLDIASVITEVNNDGSTTIKSNKIYLDEQGQSLDVAFNSLKTQVETIQDVTIDGDLTAIIEQVQSNTTQIAANKEGISTLVAENTIRKEEIQNLDGEIESVNSTLSSKYSSLEQDVSGFKTTVADTYATKQSVTEVSDNLSKNYSTTSAMNSAINQKANEITTSVSETYATKQSVTDISDNLSENYSTTSAMNSAITQKANEITTSVSETYATQTYVTNKIAEAELSGEEVDLSGYATKDELSDLSRGLDTLSEQLEGDVSGLTDDINTLNTNLNDLSDNLSINYSTTTEMNSAISQKANDITTSVSETYATTTSVNNLANNLSTNYSTTTQMNSAINQKANEITTSVSGTYATKSELDSETTTLENSISTVSQTANKINWVIASGTSSSNMTLTDQVYSLVSNNITLTADHIDLHGYVTANGGFSIDTDGNMTAVDGTFSGNITGSTFSSMNEIFQVLSDGTVETNYLSVNGTISTDILDVGHIYNPKYPACLSENTVVYINATSSGVTDYKDFFNGCKFSSFSELLDVIPANLNGNRLDIYMEADVTENVILDKFFGGECFLHMQGHTIKGYLKLFNPSMMYRVYGNKSTSTGGTTHGKIMPTVGATHYGYAYDISCVYGSFYLYDIEVYPTTNNTTSTGGVYFGGGARGFVHSLYLMGGSGGMRYAVRAYEASTVYVASSSGQANNATFCANSGSTLSLNPTSQAGTTSTTPTYTAENAQIRSTGVTFSSTSNSGSNTNTSTTTTVTKTKTIYSTSADTYRSTVYNSWKADGTVRQGDWGYGDCQGCWFFGNSLYEAMNAGTPTKVVIKITRQSGGVNAAQTHTLKYHNYTSRPSGAPTYGGTLTTFSCAVGSTATITITSSSMLNTLKSCKGLGLSIGSTSSPYSVCSGSCSVTVTYTTTA